MPKFGRIDPEASSRSFGSFLRPAAILVLVLTRRSSGAPRAPSAVDDRNTPYRSRRTFQTMSGPGEVAGDQLRAFVERIEHVEEEIKALTGVFRPPPGGS